MASRLVNLRRTLTWSDFGNPRPGPDPTPGIVATAAQCRATHSHTMNVEAVPGTRPPSFRLSDNVTVTVILQPGQMFVNAWVMRQSSSFQDTILHHEQGHYDLVALFCRDMFIEIMDVKTQTFSRPNGALQAVQQILTRYDRLIANVHARYDADARHGRNATQQTRWDGFIQTAFTQARTPAVSAPDGTPYKVQLLDCLTRGGVSI
jgi:hypothetical protein